MRADLKNWTRIEGTNYLRPPSGKATCPICFIGDFTGHKIEDGIQIPSDMDDEAHKGFTIGKGKTLYWMMIWHTVSGHVSVVNMEATYKKWIHGDTEITIHFKSNP